MPWGDGSYTLLAWQGAPMAGLMALTDELKAQKVPPHWLCYFGVPDCDAGAAEAARLGGTVLRPPADIPEVGRFAVVADPAGAVFCLHTPAREPETWPEPGLGDFTWHELATTDPVGALSFYGGLLGWVPAVAMDMGEMGTYHMFGRGGMPLGGIYLRPPHVPVTHWLPYACVASADAAADAATRAGGSVLVPPKDVPGGDRISVMTDPQGAVFAVHARAS
jgi:predicted enzyme related to lactoylglutathione lyase